MPNWIQVTWSYAGPGGDRGKSLVVPLHSRESLKGFRESLDRLLMDLDYALDGFELSLPCQECEGRGGWEDDRGIYTACYCQESR